MISSLLQKAGLRPGLALHSAIPKVLMAAVILGGSGSMLSAGSAQAATNYFCDPRITGGSGGFKNLSFSVIAIGDTVTCADKKFTVSSFNFASTTGTAVFEWVENAPIGYKNDLFSLDLQFAPSATPGQNGFFEYTVDILDPTYGFESVQLDSTVTLPLPPTPPNVTVTKLVDNTPILTSINGAQIGPIVFTQPSPITVRDTWTVGAGSTLSSIKDTLTQRNEVPGPLPLMGAGMAFGFSRKLRSRIKASAKAKA